jgi:hypothetical protein
MLSTLVINSSGDVATARRSFMSSSCSLSQYQKAHGERRLCGGPFSWLDVVLKVDVAISASGLAIPSRRLALASL